MKTPCFCDIFGLSWLLTAPPLCCLLLYTTDMFLLAEPLLLLLWFRPGLLEICSLPALRSETSMISITSSSIPTPPSRVMDTLALLRRLWGILVGGAGGGRGGGQGGRDDQTPA